MNQITFSNKIHGKVNFSMIDLIAWRKYTDVEELPQPDKIINLHPQADIEVLKKGRGRPKKIIFQPVIIPEPACSVKDRQPYEVEPEPIHQHPAPAPEPEPKPEVKRKVGRPKKALQQVIQYA